MSLVTNVFRRGGSYWFRVRVPVALRARAGRNELWRSLRTSQAGEARRRGVVLHGLTQALWRDLERAMDLSECKALIDAWLSAEINEDSYLRSRPEGERHVAVVLQRQPMWKADSVVETLDHEQLARLKKLSEGDQNARLGPDRYLREEVSERELLLEAQRKVFADGQARLAREDESIAAAHVRELFARRGLQVGEFTGLFETATRMMLRAQGDLARVIASRDEAHWREWLDDPAAELVSRLPSPAQETAASLRACGQPSGGLRLSEAAARAIPEMARIEAFKPKRIEDYEAAIRMFLSWRGYDPELSAITPQDAGDFAVALSRYPSNATKRPAYRNLVTFAERIEAAAAANETAFLDPVTVNGKYVTPLRRIVDWHCDKGLQLDNPFRNIRIRRPKRVDPRKKRRDFTVDEIRRLFALPLFVGANGAVGKKLYVPGPLRVEGWRFWVPLICLFSGMRLNEACGLAVADMKEEQGICFFHVRDEVEGQSTKSNAARRKVPVHDELITLGFLDFVDKQRRSGCERLFENLLPDADGYFSATPSKFLNQLVERIEDTDPDDPGDLVFHSSRHTVISRFRAAEVREDVARELVGHEQGDVHAGYGSFDIHTLKRAVNKIMYPGLDLSRLRQP